MTGDQVELTHTKPMRVIVTITSALAATCLSTDVAAGAELLAECTANEYLVTRVSPVPTGQLTHLAPVGDPAAIAVDATVDVANVEAAEECLAVVVGSAHQAGAR